MEVIYPLERDGVRSVAECEAGSFLERAIADVATHGDNDTLPFDMATIASSLITRANSAQSAFRYSQELEKGGRKYAKNAIESLPIFSREAP